MTGNIILDCGNSSRRNLGRFSLLMAGFLESFRIGSARNLDLFGEFLIYL